MAVEVKRAEPQGTKGGGWRVKAVRESRRKDSLICIVLPDICHPTRIVHIESMQDHLKKCSKSGQRTITDLVKK